ncbi:MULTISPECIES: MSMEG_0567/Sll0786 family nitrogen starvation N-acetyltransferase [Nonomuraea]|uniref:MSMEG_0567/Sll0786 family nitrogen starvation N-acetyltransferase n=2 Tax=Nonomuraea TaxID=83681 RepID=A0ABW1C6A8_9ACTN|nr:MULTISPECIES: MSMEG_0567/Sll0786 family nitrogen starvation N-acetyltransferase [Nonomuraea]MDA0647000.1 GNAT family N-acetyltransferase [Nonomuraea ferruginea]TXK35246.1 GNAT family N-acetyltransferase [Nonomuraea sp. C10]TXK36550.1 GNAT family N-acetyltransferase [Nonomuraea sp. C10]TXK36568.1 GNAT family N-acetyltransferase [Nonomuraea sp. C10]
MGASLSRSFSDQAAPHHVCRTVTAAEELEEHLRIRRSVFVAEQSLFEQTDQDEFDRDPSVHHVLAFADGVPAGTVRLYRYPAPDGERLWKGDRLAVLPEYRHLWLGGPLVRYAVETAAAAGGARMIAYVQLGNVSFFRRLGWSKVGGPVAYVGVPHQQMSIDLT